MNVELLLGEVRRSRFCRVAAHVCRLQGHIQKKKLGVGDALPSELDIAEQVGVGRSSVREALSALKVLGIIESQRKGGIRIVRDPVLLELRPYFSSSFETRRKYKDALEFRATLEPLDLRSKLASFRAL